MFSKIVLTSVLATANARVSQVSSDEVALLQLASELGIADISSDEMALLQLATKRISTEVQTELLKRKTVTTKASDKAVIIDANLPGTHQTDAIKIATTAIAKFDNNKRIATAIKNQFSKTHDGTWQAVVGRDFALTFDSPKDHEHFIAIKVGEVKVLLIKTD